MLLKKVLSSFSRLSLSSPPIIPRSLPRLTSLPLLQQSIKPPARCFSLHAPKLDLMEFFDDKKNWTESTKVKHGRPWRLEELRLKSNTDLHKLWYVLHKERNMLLTMEEFYISKDRSMPSHERIAKVDESMENLLAVVEERNVAFNLLETGETKQRIPYKRYNSIGFIEQIKPREYLVPWYLNRYWKLRYHYKKLPLWSKYYRACYRTLMRKERKKIEKSVRRKTKRVMSKFSDVGNDEAFVRSYFEKKLGYKPPVTYQDLIRKPKPDEIDKNFKKKFQKDDNKYYDEEF